MNCHLALLGNGAQADNLSALTRSTFCLEQLQRAPTTGYYFRTKGEKQRETFFLERNFFFPSQNTVSNECMGQGK